jgi:uncharacterized protein YjbI with pentapeptide repeats
VTSEAIPIFGDVQFNEAVFQGRALFVQAQFRGTADFSGADFFGQTQFSGTFYADNAYFNKAVFHDELSIGARFNVATFIGARFEQPRTFGRMEANMLNLGDAVFGGPVTIDAMADKVHVGNAIFERGAILAPTGAVVYLQGISTTAAVTVRSRVWRDDPPGPAIPQVSIRSLWGVDASRLVIEDVDLTRCEFAGAYNLDQLRIEGYCRFAVPPARSNFRLFRWRLPVWRNTKRQTLAEEFPWRRARGSWPPGQVQGQTLEPVRVAALYRQLRKAFEDGKNEPGAADFYYGEMEMRRHSRNTSIGERFILALYWAVSGYGLRASRAVATLLLVLGLGTIGLVTVGLAPAERVEYQRFVSASGVVYRQVSVPDGRPGWVAALNHCIDSATSLLRTPSQPALTGWGRVIEIALRLLGPLLLGLAVLAIRGRVKR